MLPGLEIAACTNLAVPHQVMHHVARVESSFNPYAIGVVGGRLVRQPKSLGEAVSTAQMLEEKGYNFSLGISQVNRYNLSKYGLDSYEKAFQVCPNVSAGARILAECYGRANSDWGKAFSCYYSGNFVTGYRHGYVQKIYASIAGASGGSFTVGSSAAIPLAGGDNSPLPRRASPISSRSAAVPSSNEAVYTLAARRAGVDRGMQGDIPIATQGSQQVGLPPTAAASAGALIGNVQGSQNVIGPVSITSSDAPVIPGADTSLPESMGRGPVRTQLPASMSASGDDALVF